MSDLASLRHPPTPDWAPFRLCAKGERPPRTRAITTVEGVGDRLRAAAFAEIQAREAFEWGARRYEDAPEDLRGAWRMLARAEDKHLQWLLNRMRELGIAIDERPVSDDLWYSLVSQPTAREFATYMAAAEERGRVAGERFRDALMQQDPISARIFGAIAEEEVSHIELALKFYDFDARAQAAGRRPLMGP